MKKTNRVTGKTTSGLRAIVALAVPVLYICLATPAFGQQLASISVTPANVSVPSGMTQQFTATGTFSDGTTQNLTGSVTWSSTGPAQASINDAGLATALAVGSTTIIATSGSVSGSAGMTVTASGLVGWWQFDAGAGNTAVDSTGNGYTATLVNGVSWVAGKIADAVSANGVNQYASIPAVNLGTTSAITWTAWVNRTYSTSGGHTLFEDSANFNSTTTGFGFFPDDPGCGGIATGVNGNVGYTLNCYAQPSSGVWHHLAVVYDKTKAGSSVISLYIDGVLKTPTSQPYTSTNTNAFGTNPLYLFSRGGTTEYAAGEVDDLRLYSQALTATQIQLIYQQGAVTLVSLAVTPANVSIAKGVTQQYTATGTYSDSSTQNLTSSVTWSSTSTAVATITSGGLATGAGTGNTTIQATSGSISGSTGLTVTAPVLVSIAVTPVGPLTTVGGTQQFTATGTYSDNSTQNLTSSVTWSSTNMAVATISAAGLATGVATGSTTIQATLGSVSGSTPLTVTATLVSITVTPANGSLGKGATQQFTATGKYSDNSMENLTGVVTWTSTNTAAATINSGGLATAVAIGSTTMQASLGGITGTTTLTVTAATLASIAVTPANPSIIVGGTQQFTATGTYTDNSTQNLTGSVTWSSTNPAVATITSGGLATGVTAGSTTIQATSGSISGSTTLTVTPAIPNPVGWWKFDDGSGTTAVDSSGNNYNATLFNGVSWVAGKIGDAVSANGTNQYAGIPAVNLSSTSAITWTAWVNRTYSTSGGHTLFEDSANFNSTTTGFGFFPDDPGCGGIATGVNGNVGYTLNCYAQPSSGVWHHLAVVYDKTKAGSSVISLYIDGVLKTPTSQPYTSTNTNAFGTNPLYLFSRGGTTEYAAGEVDDLRLYNLALTAAQIQLVYQQGSATLVSLAVTPANVSIAKGVTQQYTATGTYSDSSTQNLTSSVTWSSTSTAVATITSGGLATGAGTGNTTIQATSGSISGSTGLTVTAPVLVSIAVTPVGPLTTVGGTQQFTATGTYSDNSTQNLTSSVTWSSTNMAVATISAAGLATGVATGSTTIQATLGSVSGSTPLTVTATLVSITVTPANGSLGKGATQQFTATGKYSDNSMENLTGVVTWTSTNTAAATINSGGLATAVAIGSTTMQASLGGITGTTTLTVTAATLASIAVTPANPSIIVGGTQQFTATGTYTDNSTQNLTGSVTWSSTNPAVATITSGGLATGVTAGSTTIQATSGSISGSTTLTVTPAIPNPVGWWKFDDGSGTTAVDSSGNNYNATLFNGVSWVAGKIGDAVSANGTNQYAGIPAVNLSSTSAITWTAWVNRTYSTSGGHTLFEDSANFNSTTTGFGFFPDDSGCGGIATGVNGNVGYTLNCYAQPTSGVWHHVAVVYDKTKAGSSVISLYIDGVLKTPTSQPYTSTNTNAFGTNPLYLFSRGGTTQYAAGEVDDLRLYSQALTATQIQLIYQQGSATLVSLAVTPANASIAKGSTQQYTATGTYNDSSTQNLTSSVTWSSTSTAVATITSGGLATGAGTGNTTIQATSGSISGSTGLTVTAPVLVSIAVTPVGPLTTVGGTQQFTATGTYSDNSTQNLTSSVTWSSTNTAVATISSTGLATGVATGNTTIQAASGSINGSTGLTVTAVLLSIVVTPANASIPGGTMQQFTATGHYSDGGTLNLTGSVAWTSTNTGVATITNAGLASGVGTGSTTIQATSAGISGSTALTVTSPGQFVQWASCDSGAVTVSRCYQNVNATTGNLILIFVHWDPQSVSVTVSDNIGNTYAPIGSPVNVGTLGRFQVWYAKNISGGTPLAVTATFSGKTSSISLVDVIEYSGLDKSAPLDVYASSTGTGTFQDSGASPTTTATNETIVGLFGYNGPATPYSAGSGFTFQNYDATSMLESRPVNAVGSFHATASSSVSVGWMAIVIGLKNAFQSALTLTLNPSSVTGGNISTGNVTLSTAAPPGGATVTLTSSNPAVAAVPPNVVVAAGATTATFSVSTTAVTFTAGATITATYGTITENVNLTVEPAVMSQVAGDSFVRANAPTLGINWTPLVGVSTNVALQVVNDQVEAAAAGPSVAKEMYYGGLNWTPDQYSQAKIVAAGGGGYEGPAVRMTSNDTHYACVVYSLGTGAASVGIILDLAGTTTTLASSTAATVSAGDTIQCSVKQTSLTMTDQTNSTVLLTTSDSAIPSGYPGLVDSAGSGPVTAYVMANWTAGLNDAPLSVQQLASDNFNRANALNLGSNWDVGTGHGPIQIVSDQIQPYPSGGVQPSKEHYVAYGPVPTDQWSQFQLVFEDMLGDVGAEVRASDTADKMYVCDVNLTGPAGSAETRLDFVNNGTINTLVVDQKWSVVSAGDYIRGQAQGSLISLIDVTTGQLLLSASDTNLSSGYPGISLQALTGNPSDHIATNWSGGTFH